MHLTLSSLWSQRRGSVTIEFALAVPVLLVLMVGAFEYGRALDMERRMDRVTNEMGYMVIQATGNSVSKADLDQLAAQAGTLFAPYDFNGSIVFSSVRKQPNTAPELLWQYPSGGDSDLDLSTTTILPGFTIGDGENVIVVEVQNQYNPVLTSAVSMLGLTSQDLYRAALFTPLSGPITTLTN